MVKIGRFSYGEKDQARPAIKLENQPFETTTAHQFSVYHEAKPRPTLEDLFVACLLHVMPFLDVQDMFNLVKTSRRMKSFARLSYIRFCHVSLRASPIDASELPSTLEEFGDGLRSVEISGLNVRILDCLSKSCPNVTELTLVDPSNIFDSISFTKYLPFLNGITSLEIRKSGIYYGKMNRARRFQCFDKLLVSLAKVEALHSLKIDYIEIGDQTFRHLKSIKNLKCLHLNRYLAMKPVLPIIPHFVHLHELVLSIEDSKSNKIVSELTVRNYN